MKRTSRNSLLSLAVITVVVLAWFSPWWVGGKFLAPLDLQNHMMSPWNAHGERGFAKNHFVSDGVDQYLVYRYIAERDFRREGRVGWSSLTYGGTAQYANTMALYDDWTMQLHRWFDFKTAWHLGLLGQVLVAAYGMYVFLRGRDITEIWAACGALLWAANSQFVTWIYHRWTLGSFCWVPWILWAIDGAKRGKRRAHLVVPVFLALSFLGGTLQHAALVVLVVAAAWLEGSPRIRIVAADCVRRCAGIGAKLLPIRSGAHRAPLQCGPSADVPLWRFAMWGVLGVGLAAFMFLPCIAAYVESNRLGLHIGSHGYAEGWYPQGPLQPLFNLASYPLHLFPSLLGRCDSLDVLKLFKSELFYVGFFGTLPMIGALVAIWRGETPALARILMLAGLLLPLTPLVRILYQRLLLLFLLGGVIAFAHFMSTAANETKARLARWLGILTAAGAVLWVMASVVIRTPAIDGILRNKISAAAESGGSFGFYQEWVTARIERFIDGLPLWSANHSIPFLLLCVGIAGLWWSASRSVSKRRMGVLVLAAAAVLDVTVFAARWVTWTDLPLFAETPESRALEENVGRDGRTTTLIHPTAHMALTPFVPNLLAVYGIASIHGYDSIIPDGMLLPFETPEDAKKLGRLGVSHLVTWHGDTNVPAPWRPIWSGEAMDLYQNPIAVPKYAGFEDAASYTAFEAGGDFGGRKLTETLGLENRRRIEVPAKVGVVRIAENAAPGWKYRKEGGPWTDVDRGNDACMILRFPPSESPTTVDLKYDPPLRKTGWMVSGLSLAFIVGTSFIGRPATPSKPHFP